MINLRKKVKKILKVSIPLWMVVLMVIDAALITGFVEYYLLKKESARVLTEYIKKNKAPEEQVQEIAQEVLPAAGYQTSLRWGDLGKKLVEAGAIDKAKYAQIFTSAEEVGKEMKILDEDSQEFIAINEKNSRFLVNTLWALGLVNKSRVLDKGPMKTNEVPAEDFASTAGWTLGSKGVMQLYSSVEIIPLDSRQQDLVEKIAGNIYRPCCGNSAAFPDCNHGMAALGYIELAVKNGLSEQQIYKDLLAFNSFWFPSTYVEMAVYFDKLGSKWKDIDPQLALSADYSSAQGARRIREAVQNVPGIQGGGGGCGV